MITTMTMAMTKTMTMTMTMTMTIPSIVIEGVVQAFVAVLGIIGNIACIVILSRFEDYLDVTLDCISLMLH